MRKAKLIDVCCHGLCGLTLLRLTVCQLIGSMESHSAACRHIASRPTQGLSRNLGDDV